MNLNCGRRFNISGFRGFGATALDGQCMATVQTLEWLAAKQYSAMLSLNVIPEHVQHLSTLPLTIREKIVFYVQNAISLSPQPYHKQVLEELASKGDVELEIEINDENNGSYGEKCKAIWFDLLKKCRYRRNRNGSTTVGIRLKELRARYWKHSLSKYLQDLSSLACLDLTGYSFLDADETMYVIAQSCPHLKKVNLSRCNTITDVGVFALFSYCKKLENIKLAYAECITSAVLSKIILQCPEIKYVNVKGNTDMQTIAKSKFGLKDRGFVEINMKQVRGISAHEINEIVSSSIDSLEILKMGDTNLDLKLLSPLLKSRLNEKTLPLQKLDISWCEDCDAESLIELIRLCPEFDNIQKSRVRLRHERCGIRAGYNL